MKCCVRIFDSDTNAWLLFDEPDEVLVADDPADARDLLAAVEAASDRGQYAAGYVAYDAAPGLNPALRASLSPGSPVALFGLYSEPKPCTLPSDGGAGAPALHPDIRRDAFDDAMATIRRYLQAGDTYQVNYTYRLRGSAPADPAAAFAALYRAQPSSYACLLETDSQVICSVSPELFFELSGDTIRMEPMKGTRPRGRYPEEDARFVDELVRSEKDRAENLMIVDMIRNDLGRIAEPGSVQVDALFRTVRLPTVWQQVSDVSARTSAGLADIFAALFPCASVTGAPKRRTMEIIAELEQRPRGIYTGAIGLVKPGRRSRFSVAIRTLCMDLQDSSAAYGVGGGIVWDSKPAEEWQETLAKAKVLDAPRPEFRLLETMRYDPGIGVLLLDEHLDRLVASAAYFDFQVNPEELRTQLLAVDADQPRRLRLLVSESGEAELQVLDLPVDPVDAEVKLRLAAGPVDERDPLLFHKTTHRAVYENALAGAGDCDDVILYNRSGLLTETTISNLYLDMGDRLLTPPVSAGLLAGTYRAHLLATGQAEEASLTCEDLHRARRVLVSNSVRGLREATLVS